ncbi:MAG TPA: DUF742 domain-containing protein [Thermomonospora sp.]|nr:DUF742 domain-containing protein [Thermomonospora sp.]
MSANPWLRPYVLTGGRTRTRRQLYVHTLVSVPDYDAAFAARLLPEARRLYERAHRGAESVAELSAHCGVSLGVTRVLLGDLAAGGRVLIHPETYESPYDPRLLKEVIHGLRELA